MLMQRGRCRLARVSIGCRLSGDGLTDGGHGARMEHVEKRTFTDEEALHFHRYPTP